MIGDLIALQNDEFIDDRKWWFFTAEKREEPWSLKRIVTRSFISMVTVDMFN